MSDARLVTLGRRFRKIYKHYSHIAADEELDRAAEMLDRVERQIVNTRAETLAGLRVKIGVALFCWTHERQRIEDVIEQAGTTDERIALSILRDLIDDSRLLPKAA